MSILSNLSIVALCLSHLQASSHVAASPLSPRFIHNLAPLPLASNPWLFLQIKTTYAHGKANC